jgi:hypothetical protein
MGKVKKEKMGKVRPTAKEKRHKEEKRKEKREKRKG